MNKIQAIVYDAVGTLIHVQPSVAEIYVQVGRRFGSRLDAAEIRRRFPNAFARQERIDRENGWRTDEARERQRWRDIVTDVLDDVAEPDACFAAMWDVFTKPDAWASESDAADVIATLQQDGIQQALASNFDDRLHDLIATLPALEMLTPIIISSEVGWRKPAGQFFAHVAERLQVPMSDILFVGDDRGNDFDGARQAGMQALLFDPKRKHLDVAERIARLTDLRLV